MLVLKLIETKNYYIKISPLKAYLIHPVGIDPCTTKPVHATHDINILAEVNRDLSLKVYAARKAAPLSARKRQRAKTSPRVLKVGLESPRSIFGSVEEGRKAGRRPPASGIPCAAQLSADNEIPSFLSASSVALRPFARSDLVSRSRAR